ncbi:MAG: hypothetical protein EPO61_02030 [Nitrospirae bacterium]|nr:MAG: hypothetical protein EPO61_02030 [Nitrospirota bacterium]
MPTVPHDIAAGFFLLPLAVLTVLAVLLMRCSRNLRWAVTIMVAWAALTAALAASGTLADFGTGHPRIPILVLTQLVFVVWLAWFSRWSGDLAQMPQLYLVGLQCFRIPVELMMAELAAQNLLAVEMTFYGRNFDVLTGVTAVILAIWVHRDGEEPMRHILIGWNLMGLSFLTAALAHGLLSVPYPFQLLHLSVPTFVIASFPLVWLPTVLVPIAYLLHFVSLKRCLAERPGASESVSG